MSVASSIPGIKIPTCSSSPSCSSPSSNSLYSFRFSSKPYSVIAIRNSQTEGPLRRPVAPPVREPSSAPQPLKPTPPSQSPPSTPLSPPPQKVAPGVVGDDKNVITLEFQRQKAKELQEYFKQKKVEEADQGPFFGFIGKNEINNGR